MKLPSGQSINSPISGKNEGSSPTSPSKSDPAVQSSSKPAHPSPSSSSSSNADGKAINQSENKTVNAKTLDQLSNTWAKVKSSQPLSPEQISRLMPRGSQSNNHTINPANNPIDQQLSQLANQSNNEQKALAELKLFLVKLDTQQGLLSLLSQQTYPKGNHVLINLDAKGNWQLQMPSQGFSLTNLTAQFSSNQTAPPSLNLSALNSLPELKAVMASASFKLESLPQSMLISGKTIDLSAVQQALRNTGNTLESKLAQQLNLSNDSSAKPALLSASGETRPLQTQPLLTQSSQASLSSSQQPGTQTSTAPDFAGRFKQVEQQVNQWVKNFTAELKGTASNSSSTGSVQPTSNQPSSQHNQAIQNPALQNQLNNSLHNTLSPSSEAKTANNTQLSPALSAAQNIATNDNKSWLMKNQNVLISEFTKTMLNNNSFIPNWSNAGQFKNAGELNELFSILLAPKHTSGQSGQSIWPNNLSAQSQLNQTLQLLLSHTPDAEKDSAQSQLMRQIFNINQSLMKIQHDQIHNRLGQQQPESPTQLQISIPYAHQNHVHWAEMELKESITEDENKEKTTGWHLILRFEQETQDAFAIETQLKQNQLSVVLWATEKIQLKRLNQEIPLLKEKLNHAGFKLDNIISKHGSPSKIQKPIQQSLVDVHT